TVGSSTVWWLVDAKRHIRHLARMGRGIPHSRREVVVYFIRRTPSISAPSANTAAGLEDPRRRARRAGCRCSEGSLDSVDRAHTLHKTTDKRNVTSATSPSP